jgi:hypothetical protein
MRYLRRVCPLLGVRRLAVHCSRMAIADHGLSRGVLDFELSHGQNV